MRKWTHSSPIFKHSSQPSADGVTVRIVSRCEQGMKTPQQSGDALKAASWDFDFQERFLLRQHRCYDFMCNPGWIEKSVVVGGPAMIPEWRAHSAREKQTHL